MKIIVLYGSPHRAGNSAILADYFIQGTQRCKVQHFYLNEMQIRPCQGCEKYLSNIEHYFGVDLHIITCRTMNGEECDIPITAIPDKLLEACTLGKMLTKPRNTTVR